MDYRTLGRTGLRVSVLGFGGSPLGSVFRPIDEPEAIRTVRAAIDSGINYFDTAPFYGLTKAEQVLGKALRGVPRDQYHLATKIGRYGEQEFDFSRARTRKSVDESLIRLGVDYIDVIQCHDIEYGSLDQVVEETLPALAAIQREGKARFIGITGFPLAIYEPVLSQSEIDTALSYCHYSLSNTNLERVLPLFEKYGAGVINASPLSMGLLTDRGPPAWHPAGEKIRATCQAAARFCRERSWNIADLAIQFAISNPRVHTTIVGMATRDELKQNLKSISTPIQTEAIQKVRQALSPIQGETWAVPGQNITDEGYLSQ